MTIYNFLKYKIKDRSKLALWWEEEGKESLYRMIATCDALKVKKILIRSGSDIVSSSPKCQKETFDFIKRKLESKALYSVKVDRALVIDGKYVDEVYNLKISWF